MERNYLEKRARYDSHFKFLDKCLKQSKHCVLVKIGNLPFWRKIERFDSEINIEHKQIQKRYFNKR